MELTRNIHSLYDLDQYQALIEEKLQESEGVETDEIKFLIKDLQAKAVINVFTIQELIEKTESERQAAKELERTWKNKAKQRENRVAIYKSFLIQMIKRIEQETGKKSISGDRWTITLKPSPAAVEAYDLSSVPDKYKKVSVTVSAEDFNKVKDQLTIFGSPKESLDKTKIKDDIKGFDTLEDGQEIGIEGVYVVKGEHISVT